MQDKLHEIRVFENFQEELFETGHVIVTTEVVEKSLNYFGNAHGGYLFTLCDQVAGLVALSTGDCCNSSVQYQLFKGRSFV